MKWQEIQPKCSLLKNVKVYDASFFDFDNDGFLDLIIAGESGEQGGQGIFLYHNDGKGNFTDVSRFASGRAQIRQQIARI